MPLPPIHASQSLENVRYEIRGPLAQRALELEKAGAEIIKLNIGNPGIFGFRVPETMKRAMARQAEAEREKRAKIIAAEGEALAAGELARASDVMMAHPLALQLRNLQTLVEISVDKNSTVIFPSPLMSTIEEIGSFLKREKVSSTDLSALMEKLAPPAEK